MREVEQVSAYPGPQAVQRTAHPSTSVPAQRIDGWTRMQLDLGRPAFCDSPENSAELLVVGLRSSVAADGLPPTVVGDAERRLQGRKVNARNIGRVGGEGVDALRQIQARPRCGG